MHLGKHLSLFAAATLLALCQTASATHVDERPAYFVEWIHGNGTPQLDTEYVFKAEPRIEASLALMSNTRAYTFVAGSAVSGTPYLTVNYCVADLKGVQHTYYSNDTYKGVGWCVGFLAGWVLERRSVRFSTDVPMVTRVTRLMAGLFGYYLVSLILMPLVKGWVPGAGGTVASCFLQMFYVSFLFPWGMKRLEQASAKG